MALAVGQLDVSLTLCNMAVVMMRRTPSVFIQQSHRIELGLAMFFFVE